MVLDRSPTLDRVFHALSHPARRAILRRLSSNEQNLSELAAPMKMSFPAASKHVRVLERARLVRRRVVGRSHLCRLDAGPLKDVAEWTEGYRQHWEAAFSALDELLAEMQRDEGGAGGAGSGQESVAPGAPGAAGGGEGRGGGKQRGVRHQGTRQQGAGGGNAAKRERKGKEDGHGDGA